MTESSVLHELLLVIRVQWLQCSEVSGTDQHQLCVWVDEEGRGWVWLEGVAAVDDLEAHLVADFPHSKLLQERMCVRPHTIDSHPRPHQI